MRRETSFDMIEALCRQVEVPISRHTPFRIHSDQISRRQQTARASMQVAMNAEAPNYRQRGPARRRHAGAFHERFDAVTSEDVDQSLQLVERRTVPIGSLQPAGSCTEAQSCTSTQQCGTRSTDLRRQADKNLVRSRTLVHLAPR